MSTSADHGHTDDHADAADAHDHFEPGPATALSQGENPSPAWLPVLGAGLFLIGGTYFLASPSAPDPSAAPSASVSAAAMAPAPVAPTARPALPPPNAGAMDAIRQQLAAHGAMPPASAMPAAGGSAAPVASAKAGAAAPPGGKLPIAKPAPMPPAKSPL